MLTIEYESSVHTAAGWRGVTIRARAEKISAGMARVVSVELIDGEKPGYRQSRTGAKRQEFSGVYFAAQQVGARKRLSACEILETPE